VTVLPNLVLIYCFIIFQKLLKNNTIDIKSRIINVIIVIYIALEILSGLMITFFGDMVINFSMSYYKPPLGLLLLCYIVLKVALGAVLITFGYKRKKIKNDTFRRLNVLTIISGVLYIFGAVFPALLLFPASAIVRSGIQDLLLSGIFGIIFLKAARNTDKPGSELQNASTADLQIR
jgi:VIT1/CCC1 family predicted Fe2+/Mn2+ transporter